MARRRLRSPRGPLIWLVALVGTEQTVFEAADAILQDRLSSFAVWIAASITILLSTFLLEKYKLASRE